MGKLCFALNPQKKRVANDTTGALCTTSSTTQGGGGNFKNRKPIGEVCSESRMAERIH